jgi:anaerobic selenocysteine-containing dehydrogenase
MTSRRIFLKSISQIAAVSVVGLPLASQAAAAKVDEKDPQAAGLGYKDDTKQVDKKKFPTHDVSQTCGNCQLYQGGSAASGPCLIFSGKAVEAAGWCSAYTKKAGL